MSIVIDSNTCKKLALVKQLYQQAANQSFSRYSVVSRVLAVIGFDLAVENALRIVISALDTNVRIDADRTFPKLVQQANHIMTNAGCGAIQEKGQIESLHHIRNDAQHNGRYPSEMEVSECRNIASSFLRKLVKQIWSESFDTISLVDFVSNPIAKGYLKQAENALVQSDYEAAVKYANAGLSWAVNKVHHTLTSNYFLRFPRTLDNARSSMLHHSFTNEAVRGHDDIWEAIGEIQDYIYEALNQVYNVIGETREELYKDIAKTEKTMAYFTLGIDHSNFLRFRRIAGDVHFYRDENQELSFSVQHLKENLEREDAEFAVSYSADTTILIETQIGDIEKPFSN